jgi:hypothetical protein
MSLWIHQETREMATENQILISVYKDWHVYPFHEMMLRACAEEWCNWDYWSEL